MLCIVICIVHTDTMPSTCKNNIFPIHPSQYSDLLTPSHFLHNCYNAVINPRLREGGEEVQELKSKLDR